MKRFNKGEFFWFINLCSFTIFIIYMLVTKKVYVFIHPRIVKYLIAAAIGLVLLTIHQWYKIFTLSNDRSHRWVVYLLFLFPVIIGLNAKGINSAMIDKKGVNISTDASQNSNSQKQIYVKNGVVKFQDNTYYKILCDMHDNINEYIGKKVVINGFVYRNSSMKGNQFAVSRLIMICCAADAQVVGILSKYPNASSFADGQWVNIQGSISFTTYKDPDTGKSDKMPLILVEKIHKIKGKDDYIYS